MVTFTINIPQMLAYIPAPWILWICNPTQTREFYSCGFRVPPHHESHWSSQLRMGNLCEKKTCHMSHQVTPW